MNKIIDFHTHAYPDAIAERAVAHLSRFYDIPFQQAGTVSDLLAQLSEAGCQYGVLLPTSVQPQNVVSINNWALSAAEEHESIKTFAAMHPMMSGRSAEIERILQNGFYGIKMHPDFQTFNADCPEAFAVYEQIEGRIPVLLHAGDLRYDYSAPRRIARILDNFPKLTVIAAHLGGAFNFDDMCEHLLGRELYLDTSSALWILTNEQARHIFNNHPTDRILFGSDYPLHSTSYELSLLKQVGLPESEMDMICRTNAARLLRL
jgi:hypothetical protein